MKNEYEKMIDDAIKMALQKAKKDGIKDRQKIIEYYKEYLAELEYYSDFCR